MPPDPSKTVRPERALREESAIEERSFLDDLNPQQREAATYTGGPLLILAGAGSGKTRCLTYRFAYLVRNLGIDPGRILAITFTNKAAREMRERIERLLGRAAGARGNPSGRDTLWVSTFHSTSARLLRSYGGRVGLGPNFTIYDEDDQLALMKQVVAELGWDETRWPPTRFLAAIGRAKDELVGPGEMAARAGDFNEERTVQAYARYQSYLGRNNAADFDDLIMKTVLLLRENRDILEELREQFRHVLIDEYQDTNHAQYVFANLLAEEHRNLCVVGDDDQSIYRWRGADIRNVLEFEKDYPDAKVVRLEQNYRSTKTILEAANGVIAHNRRRKGKKLWTEGEQGDPVVYFLAEDDRQEAEFVAGEVLGGHKGRGLPYRSFAVLYRTHAQSRAFEDVFVRRAIPYQIIGGVRFYERKEIKDVLAYLRVVANPADEVSLERALGVPRRGIGPQTLARLREIAGEGGAEAATEAAFLDFRHGLYGAIRAVALGQADPEGIGPKLRGEFARFVSLIDGLRARIDRMPAAEMVREVAEKSGMIDALRREDTPEAQSRIENIQELASVALENGQQTGDPSVLGFLETAALLAAIDVMKEGDDGVLLMTAHNAKGLEFPYVFVVGLENGLFPHFKSAEDEGGLEEERRLFYVAITRAMKRLYVTHALERTRYGRFEAGEASLFLGELPKDVIFVASPMADPSVTGDDAGGADGMLSFGRSTPGGRSGARSGARVDRSWDNGGVRPVAAGGQAAAAKQTGSQRIARGVAPGAVPGIAPGAAAGPRYSPGERVLHPKWGEGVVVGVGRVGARPGFAGDVQLRVAFEGQGIKTVAANEVEAKRK